MGPFLHNLRYALSLRPPPNLHAYLPRDLPLKKRLYYKWWSMQYPWRTIYFVGMDLERNEFWEYRDRLNHTRPRRTLVPWEGWGAFTGKGRDWMDYARGVTPQWHQWLRSLRDKPPTMKELEDDLIRLEMLKRNAALADQRWAAKGSLIEPAKEEVVVEEVVEQGTDAEKKKLRKLARQRSLKELREKEAQTVPVIERI